MTQLKSDSASDPGPGRSQAAVSSPQPAASPRFVTEFFSRFASVGLLVLLIVIFSILSPQFLTVRNWQNLLVVQSVVSCMSFAALVPLIVGEFDLSLGSMIGLLVMLGAYLGGAGFGAEVCIPAMLAAGFLIGTANGLLTVKLHISSFIATLGTGILLTGLTLAISGGLVLFAGIPEEILAIGQGQFLGLGTTVWLTLLLGGLLFMFLEYTPFGRKFYAVGGSERVAFLAGIRTDLLKILAFAIAGLLVGIGSVFALGKTGAGNPSYGPELLLPAYAAAFLSVTTYRPGYYNVPGVVIAIFLLAVGFNGMNLLGAPFWAQPIFNGAVLILAVVSARAESRHIKA